jgi:hypothetical protein
MKEIYERLGLKTDNSKERRKFVNRIKLVVANIAGVLTSEAYEAINHEVSFRLALDDEDFVDYLDTADFDETLVWCEAVLTALSVHNKRVFGHLQKMIVQAIEESVLDLEVIYREGKFFRKGAEELDQMLVAETLDWLKAFPTAKSAFDEALKEYLRKDYPDAITKCYSALESLVKEFLCADRSLDKLLPELLSRLRLSDQWKAILVHFCNYAHQFGSRHGKRDSAQTTKPNPSEVEAYIYQTGLMMRLVCEARQLNEEAGPNQAVHRIADKSGSR